MTETRGGGSRKVTDIYEEYQIMPGLQQHQLRVGAVGKMLADSFDRKVDTDSIVLACLFHDMGNILKSDLKTFPDFVADKGFEYWAKVKEEFAKKYGPNEHDATLFIAEKIGLSDAVASLISGVGYANLEAIRDRDWDEMKIVEYADLRVAPHGILSMQERIAEAGKRYIGRHPDMPTDTKRLEELNAAADELERQLFEHSSLQPGDITDASAAPLIEALKETMV